MTADQTHADIDHQPSEAAYRRHRRRGEHCDACKQAHSQYVRQRRQERNQHD